MPNVYLNGRIIGTIRSRRAEEASFAGNPTNPHPPDHTQEEEREAMRGALGREPHAQDYFERKHLPDRFRERADRDTIEQPGGKGAARAAERLTAQRKERKFLEEQMDSGAVTRPGSNPTINEEYKPD
jgi:hypothetical protein